MIIRRSYNNSSADKGRPKATPSPATQTGSTVSPPPAEKQELPATASDTDNSSQCVVTSKYPKMDDNSTARTILATSDSMKPGIVQPVNNSLFSTDKHTKKPVTVLMKTPSFTVLQRQTNATGDQQESRVVDVITSSLSSTSALKLSSSTDSENAGQQVTKQDSSVKVKVVFVKADNKEQKSSPLAVSTTEESVRDDPAHEQPSTDCGEQTTLTTSVVADVCNNQTGTTAQVDSTPPSGMRTRGKKRKAI